MSTQPKTTAQMYEELTDEQVTERLATDVMGWKIYEREPLMSCATPLLIRSSHGFMLYDAAWCWEVRDKRIWNPITNENHFRMVLEKVMQNKVLFLEFANQDAILLGVPDDMMFSAQSDGVISYCLATRSTRCRAVLAAWDSLNTR